MTESKQERLMQLNSAFEAIVNHSLSKSFNDLIEKNIDIFKGLKIIYSTENMESQLLDHPLKTIEEQFPYLKKFFYGQGFLFYTDEIYQQTKEGQAEIKLDYSISFDSNIAEKFRIWENGGSLDKDSLRFGELIQFVKNKGGMNFDYSFFVIENYFDSLDEKNDRPFNSIRALKRFESLIYNQNSFDIYHPIFTENRESAGKRACEVFSTYYDNRETVLELHTNRKLLYSVLLKSILLKKNENIDTKDKLRLLIEFSLKKLGRFAKTEIYFGWKFLKYNANLNFFDPIRTLGKNSLKKIRGMSWDLFSVRYLEKLIGMKTGADFYIPFFVSFDNRFINLLKVCPIRAVIIDEKTQRGSTVYLDESEFMEDINNSITEELNLELNDPSKKIKRMFKKIDCEVLEIEISKLEEELNIIISKALEK